MTEIIKETSRRLAEASGYQGTCHNCGAAIEYTGTLYVIEVRSTEECRFVVPIDVLRCPECLGEIQLMQIWLSLNITDELKKLEKKS